MSLRLGAVTYLNARPLVYGLESDDRVTVRFDVPARCAELLHAGEVDLGLIPSIEYLRVPVGRGPYAIVPDLAIASRGPVASVALYTTRPIADVRSIALDTSSRTSVALVSVLCRQVFGIAPRMEGLGPDLAQMLARADAALLIGDIADDVGRRYFEDAPEHQALGARYLRDNIKYTLGPDERQGLELFYRYAAEAGVVEATAPLRFF